MNIAYVVKTEKNRYRYKIHDKLYDLTEFVKIHPGGQDMFNNLKPDTNITPMIYAYHKNPMNILLILPKYEILSKTDDIIIEYDTHYSYENYCELKKLVYNEIQEKKIPLYWSNQEILYNTCILSVYLGTWIYCIWNASDLSYWSMGLLAFMKTGIYNCIFHEAAHYSCFKNQMINNYLTMGGYPFMINKYWKFSHNYLHHNFTNSKYDTDILIDYSWVFRHTNTKLEYNHKFQYIYSVLFYSIHHFVNGVIYSIQLKTFNCICFLILIFIFGIYKSLFFYMLCSLLFINIGQLSHIQHECIQINTEHKNDFLYNQVSSSINYRTDDLITRHMSMSLDIQIEHHLFPNIPHSSLRQIQHIVLTYCNKNNIPYIEKSSIFSAIYSYVYYLYKMGNS